MESSTKSLPDRPRRCLADLCVVIPARNEERLVGRCVSSVLEAGVPPEHVFVIDDCSSDRTAEVLRGLPGVNVCRNSVRLGKARSLRRVIEQHDVADRFAFMALLDADSRIAPDYFDVVLRCFDEDPGAVLVCGSPRGERHNYLTAFRTLDYALSLFMYRRGQDSLGVITVAPGCASTYRSSILGALDWDGGTLVEDMDVTIQIHRKRLGRVRYAAGAVAFTQDPRHVREYLGQMTRWYSGTWQVMRLHRLPFGRQRIDLEFALLAGEGLLYSVLVCALPVLAWLWPAAALTAVLLDQAAVALAAIVCGVYHRRPDVILWCPTFPLLRVLGSAIWLRTFWREIVRKQTLDTWFSVGRYDSDDRSSATTHGSA
jgi:cellulose synthase/poly-beta-1,6-N-acetylglucosamine synthase-like glycosyltransferase